MPIIPRPYDYDVERVRVVSVLKLRASEAVFGEVTPSTHRLSRSGRLYQAGIVVDLVRATPAGRVIQRLHLRARELRKAVNGLRGIPTG